MISRKALDLAWTLLTAVSLLPTIEMKILRLLSVIAFSFVCACTKSNHTTGSSSHGATHPFPSEAELTNAVPAGLSKAELIARHGDPFFSMPEQNGSEMLIYKVPGWRLDVPTNWQYSGFSVMLTNDKVAHVGASHHGVTVFRPSASSEVISHETSDVAVLNAQPKAANSIVFHEVSDEAVPGGRHFDTQNSAKAGYIRETPDLVVTEIRSVVRGQDVFGTGINDTREVLNVTLTDADAQRFARLTERLLGKRLLISVGTEPVVAPVVRAPIETGSFTVDVQTPEEAKMIFEALQRLVRK